MRKRILALGLAVMMIVLMAGCSKGKDNAQTDSESSKPETTAVSESPEGYGGGNCRRFPGEGDAPLYVVGQ